MCLGYISFNGYFDVDLIVYIVKWSWVFRDVDFFIVVLWDVFVDEWVVEFFGFGCIGDLDFVYVWLVDVVEFYGCFGVDFVCFVLLCF